MRHASFFSGVGGLDLGFERAGIETVSVSEIDPYANAVLAERFSDAPNLGSITEVDANDIPEADIWSGGFPCQDLSVAGKRAGFAGKRSSLAFTFLDLVEQRRPRWLVLENVPGLFSSNKGADFGRLLYEMEQLGYGVSWRTLDARYYGVAQRRRRVFIVASLESDRAAEVLLECEGCERHPATSWSEGQGAASGTPDGSGVIGTIIAGLSHRTGTTQDQLYVGYGKRISGAITGRFGKGVNSTIDEPLIVSPSPDSDGVRAADGLARRLDNQPVLSFPSRFGSNANVTENQAQSMAHSAGAPAVFRKSARAQTNEDSETWVEGDVANTLNSFDVGDVRTTHAIVSAAAFKWGNSATARSIGYEEEMSPSIVANGGGNTSPAVLLEGAGSAQEEDALLPVGLDSHRYRCCGNGVVAPVAEWIGRRIVEVDRRWREEEAK